VWGIALGANSPNVVVGKDIDVCAELILERPPSERAAAFSELLSVARVGETTRQTFSLRILRLAVALRLVGVEGCDETARAVAEEIARDAAEDFPNDPVARAAHQFERVLAAFLGRLVLVEGSADAREAAERAKRILDVEQYLREDVLIGLGLEARLSRNVELLFRRVWATHEPWTVTALDEAATELRSALERMAPPPPGLRIGQAGNANYERHLHWDPLKPGVRNVLRETADPSVLRSDEDPANETRRAFARGLLTTYLPEQ
jgi:hypothetical protein